MMMMTMKSVQWLLSQLPLPLVAPTSHSATDADAVNYQGRRLIPVRKQLLHPRPPNSLASPHARAAARRKKASARPLRPSSSTPSTARHDRGRDHEIIIDEKIAETSRSHQRTAGIK
jgi:hypothetical protein